MSFHWPYALLALPVVLAALLALFVRSYRARQRLLGQFAAQRLLPALLASYSPGLRRVKHFLVILGVLLVAFALARPQWGYEWQVNRAQGVDVMFVVDTSKSMLTQDVLPSRLERAKLAIIDLVEKMQGNRVGLVAFAGQAFLQCPLTLDYDAFRQSLEAVDTSTISQGGTNIAAGLNEAAAALENSGNHKVIVLLTDGEDLEGQGIAAAKTLRDQGVTIYTVGVGTPQGDIIPVAAKDGQVEFVRDDHGQIVKSHLDAATLTAIAQASNNGFYEPLGATGEGLTQVYEAGIKTMPEQQISSFQQRLALERFQWPLALGLFLLALDPLIGTRRPSWARGAAIRDNLTVLSTTPAPAAKSTAKAASSVVALLLFAVAWLMLAPRAHAQSTPADAGAPAAPAPSPVPSSSLNTAPLAPNNPSPAAPLASAAPSTPAVPAVSAPSGASASPILAEQLYKQGDYKSAAAAYGQAADASPQDGRFRYDQGASLYHAGDYDAAAQAFQQTLSANNLNLQQQAYYGLGNSRYRLGEAQLKQDPKQAVTTWESAAKDYQNAVELNPNDTDAHYNLNLLNQQLAQLKKQLEQQQKQQQQQQNQQNQQNQQQQQDQQNQQSSQQNSSSSQQSQQQQNNQQQPNPQNKQNQQNQQGQQGQQGQQNQPQQNQSGQQNASSNPQNQQPQNGQNQPNQQNQNQSGQNQKSGQQSPSNNPGGQQPQNQSGQSNGTSGPQKPNQNQGSQPKAGQNGQQPKPASSPGQQKSPSGQPAPLPQVTSADSTSGSQPAGSKPGQTPATAGGGAATGAGDKSGENGNATVAVPGAMTNEEARQILDSLKNSERKLPVTDYDSQKEGAQDSSNPGFKDW